LNVQKIIFTGFVFVVSLLFLVVSTYGQKPRVQNDPTHDMQPVHFGYSLGLNMMDAYIFPYQAGELEKISPGFNVQIISNFRIMHGLDFRILPGLSFGQRNITLYGGYYDIPSEGLPDNAEIFVKNDTVSNVLIQLESAYFEMPFLIKYKTDRINNIRPFIIGGFNPRIDLSGIQKNLFQRNNDDNEGGAGSLDMINRIVPAYEVGVGIDFYLQYFKLGIELKYSRSIFDDVNRGSEFAALFNHVDKLESSVFFLSFHFE